jgi:hypothetical protein
MSDNIESPPQTFTLYNPNEPDVVFTGELLGSATSGDEGEDKWVEFALYKTTAGKFVCQRTLNYQGENGIKQDIIIITPPSKIEAVGFFGFSDLAKRLYKSAGINAAKVVD